MLPVDVRDCNSRHCVCEPPKTSFFTWEKKTKCGLSYCWKQLERAWRIFTNEFPYLSSTLLVFLFLRNNEHNIFGIEMKKSIFGVLAIITHNFLLSFNCKIENYLVRIGNATYLLIRSYYFHFKWVIVTFYNYPWKSHSLWNGHFYIKNTPRKWHKSWNCYSIMMKPAKQWPRYFLPNHESESIFYGKEKIIWYCNNR